MIQFKDWRLEWDGSPVAMQFDNDSVRLEIVGEMPTGYDWELLMREPEGGMDILPLEEQPDGVGVQLKRENLPKWGTYALQLRGTLQADGTTQRHSTVAEVLVPESLSGDTAWPEIPAAFRQLEARLKELAAHPPKPGSEGYWQLWDAEEGTYHDSNLPVGTGGPGAEVFYIDLAGDYPNYTCPVALADINAAYEAGKVLECRCKMGMYTATLPLFIPVPELGRWIFSGSGELADMGFPAQTFTVAVTGFGVQASNAKLATTEDKLPNPNALTITSGSDSVTYDGSEAESIDIPAGPKGDKGDPGAKGEKGDPGPQGPAGAVYSPNLLRNGTFADGCIVNQRGKTSYAGTGYGVDMWYTTGATLSVDVTAEGVKLYKNDATANPAWAQALETDAAVGQTVTVSMLYKGSGEGASLRVAQSGGIVTLANVSDWTLVQKTFALEKWSVGALQDRAIVAIQCFENMAANQGLYIKAIKLELGSQQTLAHQESGAWVLNEIPKFGEQLAACQRHLIPLSSYQCPAARLGANGILFFVPLPVTMRTLPTIKQNGFQVLSKTGEAQTGFTFSVSSLRSNGVIINAAKTGHGMTDAVLSAGTLSLLSAEL